MGAWMPVIRRHVGALDTRTLIALGASLFLLICVIFAFVYGGDWLGIKTQGDVEARLSQFRETYWAPLVVLAIYSLIGLTGAPQFMLMAAAVVIFGPLIGFVYAWLGTVFSACVGFFVGHYMGSEVIRRFAGPRINRISQRIGDHGVVASILVRVVPTAPFAVVNMVAGASHIAFGQYFIGTLLGVLPKAALIAYIGASLSGFIEERNPFDLALLGLVLLIWVGVGFYVQRWVRRTRKDLEVPSGPALATAATTQAADEKDRAKTPDAREVA